MDYIREINYLKIKTSREFTENEIESLFDLIEAQGVDINYIHQDDTIIKLELYNEPGTDLELDLPNEIINHEFYDLMEEFEI
jgi:hypothetical protein